MNTRYTAAVTFYGLPGGPKLFRLGTPCASQREAHARAGWLASRCASASYTFQVERADWPHLQRPLPGMSRLADDPGMRLTCDIPLRQGDAYECGEVIVDDAPTLRAAVERTPGWVLVDGRVYCAAHAPDPRP